MDRTTLFMFCIGVLLAPLTVVAAILVRTGGMQYFVYLQAAILLTGAFAIVGAAFGLSRGLRLYRSRGQARQGL